MPKGGRTLISMFMPEERPKEDLRDTSVERFIVALRKTNVLSVASGYLRVDIPR